MSHFDFKQFRIYHDKCAMKVGTDGVLLGAWAKVDGCHNILDIGTGTGLIAIMLGQRSSANITGIEIDPEAAMQAQENVQSCPFTSRIHIISNDIKDFQTDQLFDCIVSNPPYFEESTLPPDSGRASARHTQGLPLEVLVAEAKRLMTDNALFQVILPHPTVSKFLSICTLNNLSLLARTDICTKAGKPFKRTLLCLINNIAATRPQIDTLSLTDEKGGRSEAYEELTKDFYLDRTKQTAVSGARAKTAHILR